MVERFVLCILGACCIAFVLAGIVVGINLLLTAVGAEPLGSILTIFTG
jgi:hypothetical protein